MSEEEWQIAAPFEWGENDGQTDRLILRAETQQYQLYEAHGRAIDGASPLAAGGVVIRCRTCGSRSENHEDCAQLFCGKCKRYHLDTALKQQIENAPPERLAQLLDLGAGKGAIDPREARTPVEPPPADSIEMLLHHHPQTLNLSPFALGVQRSLRSPIE